VPGTELAAGAAERGDDGGWRWLAAATEARSREPSMRAELFVFNFFRQKFIIRSMNNLGHVQP
jgi:hypothetical protein